MPAHGSQEKWVNQGVSDNPRARAITGNTFPGQYSPVPGAHA